MITVEEFDKIARKYGAKIKTEPFQPFRAWDEALKACYRLKPSAEKSEIFTLKRDNKQYFAIGLLLDKEIADDSKMKREDADRISRQLTEDKKSEHRSLIEEITASKIEWAEQ